MHYKLKGHEAVPCELDDPELRLLWKDGSARTVKKTVVGKHEVSTVFLATNHNWFGGPPLLFETMIFPECSYCERYSTWEEAEAGHELAVASLKKSPLRRLLSKWVK
jgi:hypothetical protein